MTVNIFTYLCIIKKWRYTISRVDRNFCRHDRIIEGQPSVNIDMCFRVNILTVVDKCTITTSDLLYASSHSQTFCISIVSPRATKRGTAAILSHATILRLHTVLEAKRKERNQQIRGDGGEEDEKERKKERQSLLRGSEFLHD